MSRIAYPATYDFHRIAYEGLRLLLAFTPLGVCLLLCVLQD